MAVIAGIAVFALIQRNDANDQRDVATSRQLAGSSALARQRDPELATLLAESAYAASPTVEAEESLRQGVHDSKIRAELRMPDELALAAVPIPPGRMAVASESGNLRVWDAAKDPRGAAPRLVGKWPGGIGALAATPAGYVTGANDGAIVLWPGRDAPGPPERIASVKGRPIDMHAMPGGDRVIVATDSGAFLVGLTDHRVQRVAGGILNDAIPDPTAGGYLIAGGPDGSLQRVGGGSSSPTPIALDGLARSLAISPDRTLLAVAASDGVDVLRLGARPTTVFSAPVTGGANDVAWSDDGERLAAAGGSGAVRVFDREGRLLSQMTGHEGSVITVGWAGPTTAVSVGTDGTVRRWDVTAGVENQLRGLTLPLAGGVTFDDGGSRVAIVGADGSAESWTPGRPGTRPLLPPVPPGGVASGAAAGGLVAVGLFDGRVIVRDASGTELASADVPEGRRRRAWPSIRAIGESPSRSTSGRVEIARPHARSQAPGRRAPRERRVRRRLQPGRRHARQRRPRRHRQGLGRARRLADARNPRRPGDGGGLQPRRPLARERERRQDGARLGSHRKGADPGHPQPPGLGVVGDVRRRRPGRLRRLRRRPRHGLATRGDAPDHPPPCELGDRGRARPRRSPTTATTTSSARSSATCAGRSTTSRPQRRSARRAT